MKILICDDEKLYLDTLRSHVQEYMDNRFIAHDIITAASADTVLQGDLHFDLAFLDIQMEGTNGISLAEELQKYNRKIAIFFVTNYNEYLDESMDIRAFRFFSKPFDVGRLYSSLDKAMEYIDGAYVDIFLYADNTQQRVLIDDILYITRDNRKVLLQTVNQSFTPRQSFEDLCKKMPPLFFYQVHKSFAVNLHYIRQYNYSEVFLSDGTRIPIAPRKQAMFHKYWFEYLRRR